MTRTLLNLVAAEIIKLRGLPAVAAAALGTVAAAAGLSFALAATTAATITAAAATAAAATTAAATTAAATTAAEPVQVLRQTIPLLAVGTVLIGVLAAAAEYEGHQIITTLSAAPNRPLLLAAKTIAYLAAASATAIASVGAGLMAAWTAGIRDAPARAADGWSVLGAVIYLVLIGLLGLALAVGLRSLVPALASMLALILIVSPLLAAFTQQARWLPDQAGSLLYRSEADAVLTPVSGALVLLAWITLALSAAATAFLVRDV